MKKLLLVLLVGMVLAIDVYGISRDIINKVKEVDHIEETTITVYME